MPEFDIDAFNATITKQGSTVRQMKKDGAEPLLIKAEVDILKQMKNQLEIEVKKAGVSGDAFNRKGFDEMLVRKFFVVPAFEIHGGVAGLFDFGPPGAALKQNVTQMWREHFILQVSIDSRKYVIDKALIETGQEGGE